jgi:hypothetical protein
MSISKSLNPVTSVLVAGITLQAHPVEAVHIPILKSTNTLLHTLEDMSANFAAINHQVLLVDPAIRVHLESMNISN